MLQSKIALVVGGKSPLARAIISNAAKQSSIVIFASRLQKEANDLVKSVNEEIPTAAIQYMKCDTGSETDINSVVTDIVAKYNKIDILFHVIDLAEEKWDRVVHLKSVMFATKACIPHMIKQRYGRVVIISSLLSALKDQTQHIQYTASKAGIMSFVRAAALDLAQYNVTVNAIEPGILETCSPGKGLELMIPMGRAGKVEEIAMPAGFFASDGASYVTGQWINVSGGLGLQTLQTQQQSR